MHVHRLLVLFALGACSSESDRKPANAPGAPGIEDVMYDASVRTGTHHPGAVAGEGAAAGTGAGAALGGKAGVIPPPVDGGVADSTPVDGGAK